MPNASGAPQGWRASLLRFWRTSDPKVAVARDVVVAASVIFLLLSVIWIYSGQPLSRPPVVSIESGSMMHGPHSQGSKDATGWGNPGFGRIGTIDPGDIVLVKRVRGPEDVEVAFGRGGRSGYGGHGDVLVFGPNADESRTDIIHRPLLFVAANKEGCMPNVDCEYRIPAFCGVDGGSPWRTDGDEDLEKYCEGSSDPLRFRLERDGLELDLMNGPLPCPRTGAPCHPFYSGFITRGDNNAGHDQEQPETLSHIVRMEWVVGKARGELPWFGMVKLVIYGNLKSYNPDSDPTRGTNWQVLNARAPWDIWSGLTLTLGALLLVPLVIDVVRKQVVRGREKKGP